MAKDKFSKVDYEKYEQYFAKHIAEARLKSKLNEMFPNCYCFDEGTSIQMHGRLESGRGGAKFETTLTALEEKGVINSFSKKDVGSWRNTDYRHFLEVNPSWYDAFEKTHEQAPVFELKKAKVASEYSSDKTIATTEIDGYRSFNSYNDRFECDEIIYILHHMDEYDFRECSRTHKSSNSRTNNRSHTSYWVGCFPREQHKDLAKTVFEGHLEQYVKTNFDVVIDHLFKLDPTMCIVGTPRTFLNNQENMEYWTPKKTAEMIADLEEWQQYATAYLPLLRNIQKAYEDRTPEQLVEQTVPLFRKYLEENYPCHLEDTDKELKQLAVWMVQGKHQGKLTEIV